MQEQESKEADRKLTASRVARTKPSLALERYAGRYEDEGAFGHVDVTRDAKGLALRLGTHTGRLEHWHYDVFRIHWDGLVPEEGFARFGIDRSGAAGEIVIDSIGRFVPVAPPEPKS